MRKSTTWRVRALGDFDGIESWADRTFDHDVGEVQARAILGAWSRLDDFQIAKLETIVHGPTVLARHGREAGCSFSGGHPSRPAGRRTVTYSSDGAEYRRTIIDTREWITRPWSDPASAARWEELSEREE